MAPPTKLKNVVECEEHATEVSKPVTSNGKIYLACFASYLYILSFGMSITYTAPATVDMRKPGSRLKDITEDAITWMGSLMLLGGIPATALGGYLSHKYGRKTVIMISSLLFTSSWLMIAYAPTVGWIYAGRTISGFCTGLYMVAVPAYVAEIAPQDKRGMLSSGLPFFTNVGMLMVMSLGLVLRWSWLAISIVVVTVFSACTMVFMPESPVWLVKESRLYEAANGLKFFRGKNSQYRTEIEAIMETIRSEKQNKPVTFKDFKNPTLYKPLIISIVLMFFHTIAGAGPICVYTVEVFQRAGSTIAPDIAATVLAAVQIVASVACGTIVDNFGRRKLYIISGIGTSLMLICLGAYSYVLQHHSLSHKALGYIPMFCFSIFIFLYTFGLGSIPFVMIPEMVSVQYRSTVISISTVCILFNGFCMNKSYNSLREFFGDDGMYWFMGFFVILSVLFGYFVLPETKQKSFEEISKGFSKSKP